MGSKIKENAPKKLPKAESFSGKEREQRQINRPKEDPEINAKKSRFGFSKHKPKGNLFDFSLDFKMDLKKVIKILGCGTMLFSLFLIVAFGSHLFLYGSYDQSVFQSGQSGFRQSAENNGGFYGAFFAQLLITQGFGVSAVVLPFYLFLVGYAIYSRDHWKLVKKIFPHATFGVYWTCMLLGFIKLVFNLPFNDMGGGVGLSVNEWIAFYIGRFGTGLFLLFSLLIYLNYSLKRNISAFGFIGDWLTKIDSKFSTPDYQSNFEEAHSSENKSNNRKSEDATIKNKSLNEEENQQNHNEDVIISIRRESHSPESEEKSDPITQAYVSEDGFIIESRIEKRIPAEQNFEENSENPLSNQASEGISAAGSIDFTEKSQFEYPDLSIKNELIDFPIENNNQKLTNENDTPIEITDNQLIDHDQRQYMPDELQNQVESDTATDTLVNLFDPIIGEITEITTGMVIDLDTEFDEKDNKKPQNRLSDSKLEVKSDVPFTIESLDENENQITGTLAEFQTENTINFIVDDISLQGTEVTHSPDSEINFEPTQFKLDEPGDDFVISISKKSETDLPPIVSAEFKPISESWNFSADILDDVDDRVAEELPVDTNPGELEFIWDPDNLMAERELMSAENRDYEQRRKQLFKDLQAGKTEITEFESGIQFIISDISNDNITEAEEDLFLKLIPEEDMETISDQEDLINWELYDPIQELSRYQFPTIDLLNIYENAQKLEIDHEELQANKHQIVRTLANYGIEIKSIKATIGPTITLYEIVPADGVRISKIKNLEDDIALSLAALGIRIIAPMPGKGTIGIEIPNKKAEMVSFRSVVATEKFKNSDAILPIAIGKTIANEIYIFDLAKMPHLLVAGATGQGKSVGLNTIIASLLYKKHPSEVKFVLIDPKKVEMSLYKALEFHYLAKLPNLEDSIITDNKDVVHVLNSLCKEMDDRYLLLQEAKVRNIVEYNEKFKSRKLNPQKGHRYLPYIVLIIDELADLMFTAGKEIETPIARLAQLARAIGIHLVVATQRPSVNVITGLIKANFPARISYRVTQRNDSRTILDANGAERLIGKGDLLLSKDNDLVRIQNAFIDTPEVEKLVDHISNQQKFSQPYLLPEVNDAEAPEGPSDVGDRDPLFEESARLLVNLQSGSTSSIQQHLKIGYNRAARIMLQLEKAGVVSAPGGGNKPREILVKTLYDLENYI